MASRHAAVREKLATMESQSFGSQRPYWKVASINPQRILIGFCPAPMGIHEAFHLFAAFSIFDGFTLSYLHWSEFSGGVRGLFNLHGLFFLWM